MDIKDTQKLISRIKEDVELLRVVVDKETSDARMLLDHDVHTRFATDFRDIGNEVGIIETKWDEFGLPYPHASKMILRKKAAQGNRVSDTIC